LTEYKCLRTVARNNKVICKEGILKKVWKICVVSVLLGIVTASISAQTTSFEPIVKGQELPAPVDTVKLDKSIRSSLVQFNWRIVEAAEGSITARYEKAKGTIYAVINVIYNKEGYRIEYVDSARLDVNLEKKKIHRNYVRWVANLDKAIYSRYLKD